MKSPITPNIHICQNEINGKWVAVVVAVVEVCETGVCVDVSPGDEIVFTELTIVDYAVGCDGELHCLSEGGEREKGKEFGEVHLRCVVDGRWQQGRGFYKLRVGEDEIRRGFPDKNKAQR
jgi:hypothetical protein